MKPSIAVPLGIGGILAAIGTSIASTNGLFAGHPYLAYWFWAASSAMIAIAVAGWLRGRIKEPIKDSETKTHPPINIHLENIGNPVHDQSTKHVATSAPVLAREAKTHPNLELFDCKPGFIFYGNSVWCEADLSELDPKEHQPNSCLAIFRNKPAPPGQAGVPAYDVTAHLTYRNKKGEQQIVNFGTWVGRYEHIIDFTRGESHALVLSSSVRVGHEKDGRVYVLDNPHSYNPFRQFHSGRVVGAPDEKLLIADCNEVEVSLICKDVTVYSGRLSRGSDAGDAAQFKQTT